MTSTIIGYPKTIFCNIFKRKSLKKVQKEQVQNSLFLLLVQVKNRIEMLNNLKDVYNMDLFKDNVSKETFTALDNEINFLTVVVEKLNEIKDNK